MNAQTMKMLLPLDLQYFATDFDVSQMDDWFEEHQQEQENLDAVAAPEGGDADESVDEEIVNEEIEEVVDEELEEPGTEGGEEVPAHLSEEASKRDAAFAEMRRQNEMLAQQAAFVKQMADAYGMTPEQLQQQWADDQLAKEAEEQGVPLEFLREQNAQRQELQQLRGQVQDQRIQADIANVATKYEATQEQIAATVEYAKENGLVHGINTGAITFEAAFKLAHMDSLIEDAKKSAVQKSLTNKKQRQQSSSVKPNGATETQLSDDEALDAAAEKYAQEVLNNNLF